MNEVSCNYRVSWWELDDYLCFTAQDDAWTGVLVGPERLVVEGPFLSLRNWEIVFHVAVPESG